LAVLVESDRVRGIDDDLAVEDLAVLCDQLLGAVAGETSSFGAWPSPA
jgi:hypothetical protein